MRRSDILVEKGIKESGGRYEDMTDNGAGSGVAIKAADDDDKTTDNDLDGEVRPTIGKGLWGRDPTFTTRSY